MLKRCISGLLGLALVASAWADPSYQEVKKRGDTALAKKDYSSAIRHFEKLIYLYPGRADAHNALGFACYLDGRYEKGILQFKQALSYEPGHPAAQNNLLLAVGKLAVEQTRELEFAEAIGLLAAHETLYPNQPQSLVLRFSRGQLEFYRGNEKAGLSVWQSLAARVPTSGTARFVEAHKLYQSGKLKEALTAMNAAVAKLPKEPVVRNYLALILADLGKLKEAAAQLRKAQAENPPYIDLYLNQAAVMLRLGQLEEATAQVIKARDLRPDFASVHLWMAALHRHGGNAEAASKELGLAWGEAAADTSSAVLITGEVGQRLWLDQKPVGSSPLGLFLTPGKHKLKWMAAGKPAQVVELEAAPDQLLTVDLAQGAQPQAAPVQSQLPTRAAARSFALRDQNNRFWRSFQHFHRRPVLLMFWKVDDGDNQATMNALSALGSRYTAEIGFAVIHTNPEKKNQALSQMMTLPATYARLFDDGSVAKRYGVTAEQMPTVMVVDLDGYIAARGQGVAGVAEVQQALDAMMGRQP